jgi:hypothetical protein
MLVAPMKHWSALLPLALSVAALALVLGHVASGGVREADEGTAAHLWQLLMALQLPLIALFALIWLPRSPRSALAVLALLMAVVLANLVALSYFNL